METEEGVNMNNWVSNIVADSIGNIWIVIPDQGVFRYKDEKLYFYEVTNKEHFKTEAPDCILVRPDGDVWVGTWGSDFFDMIEIRINLNNIVLIKPGVR